MKLPKAMMKQTVILTLLILGFVASLTANAALPNRSTTLWGPYVEYSLTNASFSGNPFDLVATATFTHSASGTSITTGMFYNGSNTWKFRFTATLAGAWTVTTSSADADLNGETGTVNVSGNSNLPGFVNKSGSKWVRTATDKAFVPQYAMYAGPHYFANNQSRINSAISTFIGQHGFTGLHVPVFCRWFDISEARCDRVSGTDPDLSTFSALDDLIGSVYSAGGVVHLWAWGDSSRSQNPDSLNSESGENGVADVRLQRYIAARLGPLPGWTMGYGFDLFEWTNASELTEWRNRMQSEMGYTHFLGARATKNTLDQITENVEYSAYEQHQPDYAKYVQTIDRRSSKPSFSEDRFRFRGSSQRAKDYTFVEMRRGVWQSAMAGGVANIWGNLTSNGSTYVEAINEGEAPSSSFPNPQWFKTNATFFAERFTTTVARCSLSSNARCLTDSANDNIYLYRESTSSMQVTLPSSSDNYTAIAVNTTAAYAETNLGSFSAGAQTISLPSSSDWAIAITPSGGGAGADNLAPAAPTNLTITQP